MTPSSPKLLAWAVGVIVASVVYGVVARNVPEPGGWLNGDFAYFLPHMLSVAYARSVQGSFAVQWFTPSFCGGLPALANAQDTQWMAPQLLFEWLGPMPSLRIATFLLAALAFAGCSGCCADRSICLCGRRSSVRPSSRRTARSCTA